MKTIQGISLRQGISLGKVLRLRETSSASMKPSGPGWPRALGFSRGRVVSAAVACADGVCRQTTPIQAAVWQQQQQQRHTVINSGVRCKVPPALQQQ
jgi:hypothetical protein